jgi:hypothetical protein
MLRVIALAPHNYLFFGNPRAGRNFAGVEPATTDNVPAMATLPSARRRSRHVTNLTGTVRVGTLR